MARRYVALTPRPGSRFTILRFTIYDCRGRPLIVNRQSSNRQIALVHPAGFEPAPPVFRTGAHTSYATGGQLFRSAYFVSDTSTLIYGIRDTQYHDGGPAGSRPRIFALPQRCPPLGRPTHNIGAPTGFRSPYRELTTRDDPISPPGRAGVARRARTCISTFGRWYLFQFGESDIVDRPRRCASASTYCVVRI